jgi:hypothetical protein
MVQIHTYHSQFEDGVAVETDDGARIEAVVTHLPGESSTFTLAEVTVDKDGNPDITEIFTRPIS